MTTASGRMKPCLHCGSPSHRKEWAQSEATLTDPRHRCVLCQRIIVVEFIASPDLWEAAAGEFKADHLCLTCFDHLVPADWPVNWESVTTLWPISRRRALEEASRGIPR